MNPNPNINLSPNVKISPYENTNTNANINNANMNKNNMNNYSNNIHGMMSEREMALWKVQAFEFAITEVALFLDTHPTDQTALSYFKQYRDMKHQAESDFTRRYGPITMDHVDGDLSTWKWIDNPWPWERESEV